LLLKVLKIETIYWPMDVRIHARDETLCLMSIGNWLIPCWKTAPDIARFTQVDKATAETLKRFPEGISVIVIIESLVGLPGDEARRANASLIKRYEHVLRSQALVVESSGFRSAALRAFLSGVTLMTRSRAPTRVFPYAAEAIRWTAEVTRSEVDPNAMIESLDQARSDWEASLPFRSTLAIA
jgi:hypothetical protein